MSHPMKIITCSRCGDVGEDRADIPDDELIAPDLCPRCFGGELADSIIRHGLTPRGFRDFIERLAPHTSEKALRIFLDRYGFDDPRPGKPSRQ